MNVPLRWAQGALRLTAVVWLLFGGVSLLRLAQTTPTVTLVVIAGLMFGNVAAFLLAAWLLGWRRWWGWATAVALLLLNICLTITDQFGVFDLLILLLNGINLGILLRWRQKFM